MTWLVVNAQAFREVFEYLIEDFKAYKPIFSAIKNEYEVMLSHQREKIRELEPLKVTYTMIISFIDTRSLYSYSRYDADMIIFILLLSHRAIWIVQFALIIIIIVS